jgi:hypothetical protein
MTAPLLAPRPVAAPAALALAALFLLPAAAGPAHATAACPSGHIVAPAPGGVLIGPPLLSDGPSKYTVHVCGAQGFEVRFLQGTQVIEDDLFFHSSCSSALPHTNFDGHINIPLLQVVASNNVRMQLFVFPPNTFCAGVGAFTPVDEHVITVVNP